MGIVHLASEKLKNRILDRILPLIQSSSNTLVTL